MTWLNVFRWLHILGAAGWMGEVVVIVFVLVPAMLKMEKDDRAIYVSGIFPRLFRLASVFAGITLLSGAALNYTLTGWTNLDLYVSSTRGLAIALGGVLGLGLASFHFFVESRIEGRVVRLAQNMNRQEEAFITRALTVIPRAGLGVMVTIYLLMMVGARGF